MSAHTSSPIPFAVSPTDDISSRLQKSNRPVTGHPPVIALSDTGPLMNCSAHSGNVGIVTNETAPTVNPPSTPRDTVVITALRSGATTMVGMWAEGCR